MAIEKYNGQPWGAKIRFKHVGGAMTVDVGWVAHFGEVYLWCKAQHVAIPENWVKHDVVVEVGGIWSIEGGINPGQTISAQACVCPDGALGIIPENGITQKMAPALNEVSPYPGMERTWIDVYKAMGAPGVSGLYNGGATPS